MRRRRGSTGERRAPWRAARRVAAFALGGLLLGAGCALWDGGSPAGGEDPRVRSGETLYERHCASCHGVRGRGDGPVAGLLREEPADLTRIAARRDGVFPEPEMRRILDGRDPVVAHGSREMPVWGERFGRGFTGEPEAAAPRAPLLLLVEYLESIQRPAASESEGAAAPSTGPDRPARLMR